MKRRIYETLCLILLLVTVSFPVYAEEDEIISPPVKFVTTQLDTGEIQVTLNWENQTITSFDYAVVYDDTKVKVKSVRLKGDFMALYAGDGKSYGGMAVTNDNGGYVVLGGIFEVQEGHTAPVYDGVVATIVLAPKTGHSQEPGNTQEPGENTNIPSKETGFDPGNLNLIDGASNYENKNDLIHAANTAPKVSYHVNTTDNLETTGPVETETYTENPVSTEQVPRSTGEDVVTVETPAVTNEAQIVSGQSMSDVSTMALESASVTGEASKAAVTKPKNKNHKDADSDSFPIWIPLLGVCVLAVVAVYVIRKKTQEQ